jgi:lipopolysaccharide export system protein LptA
MPKPTRPCFFGFTPLTALVALIAVAQPSLAERADRGKPMNLESDQPCTVDLVKQVHVCSGNVVISQGTLLIQAERVEVRQSPEGYQFAVALGSDAQPARYRQRRNDVDEVVEGSAHRIDYDGRANLVKLSGHADVRRLRGKLTADEIHGAVITWDSSAELFNVQGGAVTPDNPSGRVRAVLMPRSAASAAASGNAVSTPAARSASQPGGN